MNGAPLTLRIQPGADAWAPSRERLAHVPAMLTAPSIVVYHPRAAGLRWRAQTDPTPGSSYYSFRAWTPTGQRISHILCDETETPESVVWATLHELTHQELPGLPYLARTFRTPKAPDYHTSDRAHEDRPEERLANYVADMLAPLCGIGTGYGRPWWRKRVDELVLNHDRRSQGG